MRDVKWDLALQRAEERMLAIWGPFTSEKSVWTETSVVDRGLASMIVDDAYRKIVKELSLASENILQKAIAESRSAFSRGSQAL